MLKIDQIFSNENKYKKWLQIEKLVLNFLSSNNYLNKESYLTLEKELNFDVKEIEEEEIKVKHDFVAFLNVISRKTNIPEKKWIHYGLTTSDVVDTANSLLIKEVNELLLEKIDNLLNTLKEQAFKYKDLPQIGRTHGIHAEITSFGHQFALYYSDLTSSLEHFNISRKNIECAKISGSVGTFANTGPKLQTFISDKLFLHDLSASTQVISRERYASYFYSLNLLSKTINKIAVNLRTLSRTEIFEINEFFDSNQIGSSSMPHKRNPITLENICGLTRLIDSYANASSDNISLWDNRDISHSSVERIILLDATTLMYQIIDKITKVISTMIVNKDMIEKNINLTKGNIFSQTALLKLIPKVNKTREELLIDIKKISENVIKNNTHLKIELQKSDLRKYLDDKEFEEIFDYKYHTQYINNIYERVFKNEQLKSCFEKIIWKKHQIDWAIDKLANKLNEYYKNKQVIIISIIEGATPFTGQLLTKLNFETNLISIKVSFYGQESEIDKNKKNEIPIKPEILKGKTVLILDDLFDCGHTTKTVSNYVQDSGAIDTKTCVLFTKHEDTPITWYGLKIPNELVAGYGLDSKKKYRNANFLGILKKEFY